MPTPFLESSDIYLRPLMPEDADGPYASWFNDAEVCRGNAHHQYPYSRKAALEYIQYAQKFEMELILAIVQKSDQRHIGNVNLKKINAVTRSAEFAIVIGEKDCWGKGYSKQVAHLLLGHAFFTLNLNRVFCGTFETNHAMRKLAISVGMQEEGRRRQAAFKNSQYIDIIEYGVLRDEYLGKFGALGEELK
ncbi:MAG: GNAT family N-acetyltransferase [Chloroflexi bacterium]|jgi:[ribosomal protein S5]-alanine N-acetyltransferase|nr:GNAT family N-acetyltransferase [Chloroflexota bacterium]